MHSTNLAIASQHENSGTSMFARAAEEAEVLLKAIANRHRLMVLHELRSGEKSVGALQEAVGISQSTLSQHLARLRADRIVKTRRSAQTIFYSIAYAKAGRLMDMLDELHASA